MKISNLAQEPNPFEQSFSESTLVKEEKDSRSQAKFTLPSISLIGQGSHLLPDEPIKLSPLILDPSSQAKGYPQLPHSFQNSLRHNSTGLAPSKLSHVTTAFQNPSLIPTNNPILNNKIPSDQFFQHNSQTQLQSQVPTWSDSPQVVRPASLVSLPPSNSQSNLFGNYPPNFMPIRPLPNSQLGSFKPNINNYMVSLPKHLSFTQTKPSKKSTGGRKRLPTDGMSPKKIDFLERNRKAALKCRQRKKDEYKRVEETMRLIEYNNNMISKEIQALTQEAIKLRSLIASHGFCPIAQANGVLGEATLPNSTQLILPPQSLVPNYSNRQL